MMRWIILFSCFSFLSLASLFLLYCCLLPQLMLELVMLWCFVCYGLGVFSPLPFVVGGVYKFIQFLLHSGITNVDAGGDFSFLFLRLWFFFSFYCFFFILVLARKNVSVREVCEAFTRLIFVGNFSTINVSTERKKSEEKKGNTQTPRKHKTFFFFSPSRAKWW